MSVPAGFEPQDQIAVVWPLAPRKRIAANFAPRLADLCAACVMSKDLLEEIVLPITQRGNPNIRMVSIIDDRPEEMRS